jgi:hypothetical protein
MKKLLFVVSAACILLTGCLETIQEITLNDDGSGNMSTTSDMGAILGMAKQMGGGAEMEKAGEKVIDTTILLAAQAEDLADISSQEKEMLKKGSMHMKMDINNEVFKTKLSFPFNSPDEIETFTRLTGKLLGNALKDQMEGQASGMGEMPAVSSFDDYYKLEFSKGELKKKLNKEKYSSLSSDEYLNGLKEAAAMGIPVGVTYIINLPKPAEKVEGKNVTLSDDKKKVTIKADLDDLFNDPEKLEFKIKY